MTPVETTLLCVLAFVCGWLSRKQRVVNQYDRLKINVNGRTVLWTEKERQDADK